MPVKKIPYDLVAEQSVLGSMMLSDNAVEKACEKLYPTSFYVEKHQIIFKALVDLHDKKVPIDLTTLTSELTTANKINDIGGVEYIADLLQKYAKKYDYDSIVSMVSYNNSTVEQYKLDAEKAIDYRDRLYTYHYAFINDLDTKIKNNDAGITDFVLNYQNYLKGLPKEESEQEEGN